MLVTAFVVLN